MQTSAVVHDAVEVNNTLLLVRLVLPHFGDGANHQTMARSENCKFRKTWIDVAS
jgi:hypothetical protein